MSKLQSPVLLAKIGAPHGVHGQVRVTSFTRDPLAVGDYGPLTGKDGRTFTITKMRPAKNVLIVTFRELDTRELAQSARGLELFVERKCLPENTDEDEFYIDDLVGMQVFDKDLQPVGRVHDIANFGAGDLLEISPQLESGEFGSSTWFLAFTKINVPEIDLKNRRIFIVRPAEISERDSDGNDGETSEVERGRNNG